MSTQEKQSKTDNREQAQLTFDTKIEALNVDISGTKFSEEPVEMTE